VIIRTLCLEGGDGGEGVLIKRLLVLRSSCADCTHFV